MSIHSDIRHAVLMSLKQQDKKTDITWFDGRPGFIDTEDLPAIAVYLSDAQYGGDYLDNNNWTAVLHIEVFTKASQPDSALDALVETIILPAIDAADKLNSLLESITPQGYDYLRDAEAMTWGSADVTYLLRYDM